MSHTGLQQRDEKTPWTILMDRYVATQESIGYCNKLFEDATKEYRTLRWDMQSKETLLEALRTEIVKAQKNHAAAYKEHKKDQNDQAKKEAYEKARTAFDGAKAIEKEFAKMEKKIATLKGDCEISEKKRWDSFVNLAKMNKHKEQLFDDAIKLEKELEEKEERHAREELEAMREEIRRNDDDDDDEPAAKCARTNSSD
jgi:hypothetical protein